MPDTFGGLQAWFGDLVARVARDEGLSPSSAATTARADVMDAGVTTAIEAAAATRASSAANA